MTDRIVEFLAGLGWRLRRMDSDHYTATFDCGRDEQMTKWFGRTALKWQNEDMCSVWILSPQDNETAVYGFFTLSSHLIIPGNVAKDDRASLAESRSWVNGLKNPFPAQLLGKFALDKDQQGKGLSLPLMLCVYVKHLEAAEVAGAKFLVVDVQEEALVNYYQERFGFIRSSQEGAAQMYRPTKAIREDVAKALADV